VHREIDYSVGGKLQPQELGELLLAAAGSRYSPSELDAIIAKSTTYVTARDSGKLVGFGRLLSDGVVIAYINNMAVSPEYQQRGIGKAILDRLVETAGNVKSIFLYSDTADQFYVNNGFERSEKRLYVRRRGEMNR
jgi:N-acetylglutamate synthase-like GNAT family acetyltransferase